MREKARNSVTRSAESATSSYTASFSENTPRAVSVGVNPLRARVLDISESAARSSPMAWSSEPDMARSTSAYRSSSSRRISTADSRPRTPATASSLQRPTTLSWWSRR